MSNITSRGSHEPTGPDHTVHPLVAAVGDTNRHDYGAGPAVLQHLNSRGLDVDLVSCAVETWRRPISLAVR
jgi:hypothetical protein